MFTPLHAACASGQLEVVRTLVDRGVDLACVTVHGNNPLHIACVNGQDLILRELLNNSTSSLASAPNHKGLVSCLV